MKFNFSTLFFATFCISYSIGNLQGPESDLVDKTNQYERKAAKGLDDESPDTSEESEKEISEDSDDSEKFVKILAEDLNMASAGIKIVKAPDLSKENDNNKITETLAMMLESQEKWIQKFEEELEEMNKNEVVEEPVVEKTADEIEGRLNDDLK